jgi:uncharacterized protein YqfA (UPF0365 family)
MSGVVLLLLAGVVVFLVTAAVSIYIYYGRLYMKSRVANADVSFPRMFRMTLSGVSAFRVVTAYLGAKQAGFDVALERFEDYARGGGDPLEVARRMESARRSGEALTPDAAFASDEAGVPLAT